MNCEHYQIWLEQSCDQQLSASDQQELDKHLQHCSTCQSYVANHCEYQTLMKRFDQYTPVSSEYARLMRSAKRQVPGAQSSESLSDRKASAQMKGSPLWRSGFTQGFVAASMVFAALLVGFNYDRSNNSSSLDHGNRLAVNQNEPSQAVVDAQPVFVVINVPVDISNAELSLDVPNNLAIEGFEEFKSLVWNVDLTEGANQLSLPVKYLPGADSRAPAYIVATLTYQNQKKEFKLLVTPQSRQTQGSNSRLIPLLQSNHV